MYVGRDSSQPNRQRTKKNGPQTHLDRAEGKGPAWQGVAETQRPHCQEPASDRVSFGAPGPWVCRTTSEFLPLGGRFVGRKTGFGAQWAGFWEKNLTTSRGAVLAAIGPFWTNLRGFCQGELGVVEGVGAASRLNTFDWSGKHWGTLGGSAGHLHRFGAHGPNFFLAVGATQNLNFCPFVGRWPPSVRGGPLPLL